MNNTTSAAAAVTPANSQSAPTPERMPIYRPSTIGIRITYKCNAECRHCYNSSLPGSDVFLDEDRILGLVEEGRQANFTHLGLSGGEALLQAKTVAQAIKVAKASGYKGVNIGTNGFWGRTPKSAENVIRMLKDAGFSPPDDFIWLSAGEYHQEYVAPAATRNAVRAYHEAFGAPIHIYFEYSNGNERLAHRYVDFLKEYGIERSHFRYTHQTNMAAVGRGKERIGVGDVTNYPVENFGLCPKRNSFIVQPEGTVLPCCGHNRFINGIIVGDVHRSTVPEIIADSNRQYVYHYLAHKPLREIHAILRRRFDLPGEYTHRCDACQDMFNTPEKVAYLEGVAREELGDKLHPEAWSGLVDRFGGGKPKIRFKAPAVRRTAAE